MKRPRNPPFLFRYSPVPPTVAAKLAESATKLSCRALSTLSSTYSTYVQPQSMRAYCYLVCRAPIACSVLSAYFVLSASLSSSPKVCGPAPPGSPVYILCSNTPSGRRRMCSKATAAGLIAGFGEAVCSCSKWSRNGSGTGPCTVSDTILLVSIHLCCV